LPRNVHTQPVSSFKSYCPDRQTEKIDQLLYLDHNGASNDTASINMVRIPK